MNFAAIILQSGILVVPGSTHNQTWHVALSDHNSQWHIGTVYTQSDLACCSIWSYSSTQQWHSGTHNRTCSVCSWRLLPNCLIVQKKWRKTMH